MKIKYQAQTGITSLHIIYVTKDLSLEYAKQSPKVKKRQIQLKMNKIYKLTFHQYMFGRQVKKRQGCTLKANSLENAN